MFWVDFGCSFSCLRLRDVFGLAPKCFVGWLVFFVALGVVCCCDLGGGFVWVWGWLVSVRKDLFSKNAEIEPTELSFLF